MVHLTLFLIMIIYLVSVVVLVVVGEQIRRRWYRWEQVDGADITLLMNNFADDLCYRMPPPQPERGGWRARLAWRARVAWAHEPTVGQPDLASTLEFVAIRQRFLAQAREMVDDQHHDAPVPDDDASDDEPAAPAAPPPAAAQRVPAAHSSRVYAFNFNEYLYMRMASVLSEFVELPPSLWGCLAVGARRARSSTRPG